MVMFSIMIGHLNTSTNKDKFGAIRIMKDYNKVMNLAPVTSIVSAAINKECPTGSKKEILGRFYGIKSGCMCDDGKVYSAAKCAVSSSCTYVNKRKA